MEEKKQEDFNSQKDEVNIGPENDATKAPETPVPTETLASPTITDTRHMLEKPSFFFQHRTKIVFGLLLVIIALLAGYIFVDKNKTPAVVDPTLALFDLEDNGPVAEVNGTKISFERYAETIKELSGNAQQQGADLSDLIIQTQIKDQALTLLIDTTLLLQEARDSGFEASEEEIDTEYDLIEERVGGSESLSTELANIGLTEEKLRTNLGERIIITKYLESGEGVPAVEVTEEEIREFYNTATETLPKESIPPFEDVRSELEAQLILQKQQESTATFVNILKENADIEINI